MKPSSGEGTVLSRERGAPGSADFRAPLIVQSLPAVMVSLPHPKCVSLYPSDPQGPQDLDSGKAVGEMMCLGGDTPRQL